MTVRSNIVHSSNMHANTAICHSFDGCVIASSCTPMCINQKYDGNHEIYFMQDISCRHRHTGDPKRRHPQPRKARLCSEVTSSEQELKVPPWPWPYRFPWAWHRQRPLRPSQTQQLHRWYLTEGLLPVLQWGLRPQVRVHCCPQQPPLQGLRCRLALRQPRRWQG